MPGIARRVAAFASFSRLHARLLRTTVGCKLRHAPRGGVAVGRIPGGIRTVDALQRLIAAAAVREAGRVERSGAPLRYRWGLYSGSSMYPAVRRLYFTTLDRTMFGSTRSVMRSDLRSLPDAPRPTDDYGDTYSLLKAYLVTTSNPDKATAEFLTPVLVSRWTAGREIDTVRAALAARQFDTYANELRFGNPYALTADAGMVDRGRAFLRQFAGSERIYQFMIAEADKANPPIQFNQSIVSDAHTVPGAFTKAGWTFMDNASDGLPIHERRTCAGDGPPWRQRTGEVVAELRARTRRLADHAPLLQGAQCTLWRSSRRLRQAARAERQSVAAARALFTGLPQHRRPRGRREGGLPASPGADTTERHRQADRDGERSVRHCSRHAAIVGGAGGCGARPGW